MWYVAQYRTEFYEQLRSRLNSEGISLDLVFGDPPYEEQRKSHAVNLEWATFLPSKHIRVGKWRLTYQPIAKLSKSYDLVIVEQANKLLVNPLLLCMNALGLTRVAFWGHGKDFQGNDNIITKTIKRALASRVHWWFAYNDLSASAVRESGFPDSRITRVMNTIDSRRLSATVHSITPSEMDDQRQRLGLRGGNVCIYVGGMYTLKRLEFLLASCKEIRKQIPDFEMLFLGNGVQRPLIERFVSENRWAIDCGPTFGRLKATYLKLAKLLLMPGLVGLGIIDSFAAEVPIVTTCVPFHSPEIDYLIDGENGIVVDAFESVDAYASEVVALLSNGELLASLRHGCRESAKDYTMESMVDRFADGVILALRA